MSNWLSKSKTSFKIASANDEDVEFINNKVHCFYYGCVQLLKHVVHKNFDAMTVEQLEIECNRKEKPENKGTHQFLREKIRTDLNERSERIKSVDFNSKIINLHTLRTQADYGIDDISANQLLLATEYSNFINNTLSKFYTI